MWDSISRHDKLIDFAFVNSLFIYVVVNVICISVLSLHVFVKVCTCVIVCPHNTCVCVCQSLLKRVCACVCGVSGLLVRQHSYFFISFEG